MIAGFVGRLQTVGVLCAHADITPEHVSGRFCVPRVSGARDRLERVHPEKDGDPHIVLRHYSIDG